MTDTPETDAIVNQFEHLLPNWLASEMAAVARKLERERDESIRYADSLAELLPVKMLPKDIENVRNANSEMAQEICRLERERDIWRSRADAHQQDYEQLLRRIDAVAIDRDGWKRLADEDLYQTTVLQ